MKSFKKDLFWVCFWILAAVLFQSYEMEYRESQQTQPLLEFNLKEIQDEHKIEGGEGDRQHLIQSGYVTNLRDNYRFHNLTAEQQLSNVPLEKRFSSYYFQDKDGLKFTYTSIGVNKRPYFVNSFLVGFKPFDTQYVWMPMAAISQRKNYLLDHKLYGPNMLDIWQNSEQAYRFSHGDCEDHALIVTDWLISLGYDAKVVIGEYQGQGGHAWVLLNYKGRDYVIESTDKRRVTSIANFLPAQTATKYLPTAMFNRDLFWENSGSKYTSNYRSDKWQLRSRFERSRQLQVN